MNQAIINPTPYFERTEVSNSDLSWLKQITMNYQDLQDYTNAYRLGSLVDGMLTEPHKLNYFRFTLDNEQYTREEFAMCEKMKNAARADEFFMMLLKQSTGQVVKSADVKFNYGGFEFTLPMRCKYDGWIDPLSWGWDLKSTNCTSQKQFEEAVRHFDYDRSRVVYMKISGAKKDMIMGISKINYKIFKVPVSVGCELWKSGEEKLNDLGFKYWTLFEGVTV